MTRSELLGAIPDLRIAPRSEYRAVVCESQLSQFLSLKDIMDRYNVVGLLQTIDLIQWLECYAKRRKDSGERDAIIEPRFLEMQVKPVFNRCVEFCNELNITRPVDRIEGDITAHLLTGMMTVEDFRQHLRQLRMDIEHGVNKRAFLYVHPSKLRQVQNWIAEWEPILKGFNNAAVDVGDAMDCFAVGKDTAAVFHTMRVVEWGLRAFCVHLGFRNVKSKIKASGRVELTPIEYTTWEIILNQLQPRVEARIAKLKRGPTRQKAQEKYNSLMEEVRGFKDAWRNHVMHTRASYHSEDVIAIMASVRRFMKLLSDNGIRFA